MKGYTKLYAKILKSSLWYEDDRTRIVWITLLALKDKNGFVESCLRAIADDARVPFEDCRRAMEKFEAPDPDSASPEYDGRRIERVPGGWMVLNHAKYRDGASDDPNDVANRERVRKWRERHLGEENTDAKADTDTDTGLRNVTLRNGDVMPDQPPKASRVFQKPSMPDVEAYESELTGKSLYAIDFWEFYESKGWKVGSASMKDWKCAFRRWVRTNSSGKYDRPPRANERSAYANGDLPLEEERRRQKGMGGLL